MTITGTFFTVKITLKIFVTKKFMLQNMTRYEPDYKQGPEIFFKTKNMKNKLFFIEQDIFSLLAGRMIQPSRKQYRDN
jgi:hypothetical protein